MPCVQKSKMIIQMSSVVESIVLELKLERLVGFGGSKG